MFLPWASGKVALCQDTRGELQRESSEESKSQYRVTHTSPTPTSPKPHEFFNRPACCPPWTEMLPLWGNLAVSWPGQEPPFPSRRTWACDCPQVRGRSCIGGRATRDSRQFFWNPPDSDQALAEERVLAQEPGGWVRGLGPPLVPCAGLLPDLPSPQLGLVSLLADCSVLSHQMSCLGTPEPGLPPKPSGVGILGRDVGLT